MKKSVSAVLVAAGSSTRMGFDKLSFDLGGETVLQRSVRAFDQCPQVQEIILVAGRNRESVEQAARGCYKPVHIVSGGATRAESAKNGVLAARCELVAVHDAARPFVSGTVIETALQAAERWGAAAPAVPVKDTVKVVREGCVQSTPDRASLFAAQTPQVFSRLILETALSLPGSFTDDASAVEAMGVCVRTLAGDYENLKITTPEDLVIARLLYERRPPCESATATTSTV